MASQASSPGKFPLSPIAGVDLLPPEAVLLDSVDGSPWVPHALPTGWGLESERLSTQVTLELGPHTDLWRVALCTIVKAPTRIRALALPLEIETVEGSVTFVDRTLRQAHVTKACTLPACTPLWVEWQTQKGDWFQLTSGSVSVSYDIAVQGTSLRIAPYLDAMASHPVRSWTEKDALTPSAPVRSVGSSLRLSLWLRKCPPSRSVLIPSRFPLGKKAAMVLTHHPDFDDTDRLKVFLHSPRGGWCGKGLRWTWGVFPRETTAPKPIKAPTLVEPTYRSLIEDLHRDGSEIVPHGIAESNTPSLSQEEFDNALAVFVRAFSPRSWIDHGLNMPYSFSLGGDRNFQLLSRLKEHGVDYLWAYGDVVSDPSSDLNLLREAGTEAVSLLRASLANLAKARPAIAAHYLRTILYTWEDAPGLGVLRNVISTQRAILMAALAPTRSRKTVGHAIRSGIRCIREGLAAESGSYPFDDEGRFRPVLFPSSGNPLHAATKTDTMLFSTMEALHPKDAYTEAHLQKLCDDRGIHIGHCYILNAIEYLAGVFQKSRTGTWELDHAWASFVDAASALVNGGPLWNPTMGELGDHLVALQELDVIPREDGATVINNGISLVQGFTLLVRPREPRRSITWGSGEAEMQDWGDWLALSGDVRPNETVDVRF